MMDFTGGYRNHFTSNIHYNYFSGNGFNLRQDLNALFAKSPAKSPIHTPPRLCFENGTTRKRTSSCPLPTPKNTMECNGDPPLVVDDCPDDKLLEHKIMELPEESINILITGPPFCGKARLVEILANRSLKIQKEKGPSLVFNKTLTIFGMKVNADIWYMKNPKECSKCLKDVFSDKNLAIILVYDVTVTKTLLNVQEHILCFKRVFGRNVPIILVGNKTAMRTLISKELSMLDWGLLADSDGQQVKEEYKLIDFVECTGETGQGIHDLIFKASTAALNHDFKF